MRRRISLFAWLFAAFTAGLAGACVDLSDDLEFEPCTVEDDCWHTQECARTLEEATLGLPGLCVEKGSGCVEGQQLGCACVAADVSLSCLSHAVRTPSVLEVTYPLMQCDAVTAKCVVMPPEMMNP